jgi:hypothetical protein
LMANGCSRMIRERDFSTTKWPSGWESVSLKLQYLKG